MKRQLTLAITMMMFAGLLATTAHSQSANSRVMRAHVPFAFYVGSRELPAGEYNITVLNPSSDQKVLQIRSTDGRVSAIVTTLGVKAKSPEKSKVVFHRYGDSYYFAQAHVAGELTTLAAAKSSAEAKQERIVGRNGRNINVAILAE